MRNLTLFSALLLLFLISCGSGDDSGNNPNPQPESMYFPPVGSSVWESVTPASLNWDETALQALETYLNDSGTKSFIILKNGKIAMEWYGNGANANTNHQWNSAGKTLCGFVIGIAQEEGLLTIGQPSNQYLGNGWSSLSPEQENSITVWHHLTMTTGLDYTVTNNFCYDTPCLTYKNAPGLFWYYHNAPYTLLQDIVAGAAQTGFQDYFNEKLRNPIGMQGQWIEVGYNKIYFSTARSMARFGILIQNKGVWENTPILGDLDYYNEMVNTSQAMNKSYGYLWWLNGKDNFRVPGSEDVFQGKLVPTAPNDLFAAMGKDDQRLYILPSEDLVVVRMGDNAEESQFGPSSFDSELWELLSNFID